MWFAVAGSGVAANNSFAISLKVGAVMEAHCFDCHGQDSQKGDVRLDNLAAMDLEARLDVLNRVQEQLFLKEMPPKKKEQPSEAEQQLLSEWVRDELRKHKASKLEEKLRYPGYGNYVDHD
ncbi:MAG: c-type cytochrome domain-containing protein, partial [Verrucomicrobiota bacterium]|nr:c-type cytochrome domain-containing protein [Verrucomicrobiota bacterium]